MDLDWEDIELLDAYSNRLVREGRVERYVYPPFGVKFGFPDKP